MDGALNGDSTHQILVSIHRLVVSTTTLLYYIWWSKVCYKLLLRPLQTSHTSCKKKLLLRHFMMVRNKNRGYEFFMADVRINLWFIPNYMVRYFYCSFAIKLDGLYD